LPYSGIINLEEMKEMNMTTYEKVKPSTPRNRGDYEAPHMSPVTPEEDIRTIGINRSTWGAIFCGVVTTFLVQMVINLASIGIGAVTLENLQTGNTTTAPTTPMLPLMTASWLIASGIIAAFAGGLAAGRMSGEPRESTAGWHGFLSWGVSVLLISFFVTGFAGRMMVAPSATPGAPVTQSIYANADFIANSALTGVALLVLGALAAVIGGRLGTVKPTMTDVTMGVMH
jgi:hypothetical protein